MRRDVRARRSGIRIFLGGWIAIGALVGATVTGPARAQDAAARAAAEGLFIEAKARLASGDYAAACPKFEESQRLVRGIGVTLFLADCYEHSGRTASAWAQFQLAESIAVQQHDRRASVAHERAAALEPHLAHLTVSVSQGADIEGVVVEQDGSSVGRARWGTAIPVDPGQHALRATAPGKVAWEGSVDVPPSGSSSIEVPLLTDAAPQPESAPPTPPTPSNQSPAPQRQGHRLIPLVWTGFGIAGAGAVVGGITGILAFAKTNTVKRECTKGVPCPDSGDISAATTLGTLSTVAFIVAGAGAVTGTVALIVGRHKVTAVESGAAIVPIVGPGSLGLEGTF